MREGESYPGPECSEWVLPEKWNRGEEERRWGGAGEKGWMLYIGRNVRGRLGHWLLATDHMLTIFLQKSEGQ